MKKVVSLAGRNRCIEVEAKPIVCPYCHQEQMPELLTAVEFKDATSAYAIFCKCCHNKCEMAFNVAYDTNKNEYIDIIQGRKKEKSFEDVIKSLSPSFCEIYNEAYASEQMGLSQITGVGYRKALEFLIKDYLISKSPDEAEAIKAKMLGRCISEDIKDSKIKSVALRAAWLGNDETHYVRKWESMDITHLKKLIELCLHWIESEIMTERMLDEMPIGK